MLENKVSKYTQELFESWEASETIIDDKKAIYILKAPDSEYRKVCMFVDGHHCMIYGDYGNYVFDNMTWIATPHNLRYDNLDYQLEKMDYENKEHLAYIFNSYACEEDIYDWFKDKLKCELPDEQEVRDEIIDILNELNDSIYIADGFDVSTALAKKHLDDYESDIEILNDLILFTYNALRNSGDKTDFIAFLNYAYDELSKFEDPGDSDLWEAGKRLNDRLLISLYAMEICSKKLKEKENILDDIERD